MITYGDGAIQSRYARRLLIWALSGHVATPVITLIQFDVLCKLSVGEETDVAIFKSRVRLISNHLVKPVTPCDDRRNRRSEEGRRSWMPIVSQRKQQSHDIDLTAGALQNAWSESARNNGIRVCGHRWSFVVTVPCLERESDGASKGRTRGEETGREKGALFVWRKEKRGLGFRFQHFHRGAQRKPSTNCVNPPLPAWRQISEENYFSRSGFEGEKLHAAPGHSYMIV
ncbi:hypothetical protein RRG08_024718 [Elysia crispata]|uniref:Uncharacterized protein n=1 Tax=Elysia crispata TaxID=231223 RepID=A0AAE0YDS1_9GAST|nr:hypothetical protein RRG08_024718 [Elysia crispata]